MSQKFIFDSLGLLRVIEMMQAVKTSEATQNYCTFFLFETDFGHK